MSLTDRRSFDCFWSHNEGLGDTREPREPAENEMSAEYALRLALRYLLLSDIHHPGGAVPNVAEIHVRLRTHPD